MADYNFYNTDTSVISIIRFKMQKSLLKNHIFDDYLIIVYVENRFCQIEI